MAATKQQAEPERTVVDLYRLLWLPAQKAGIADA